MMDLISVNFFLLLLSCAGRSLGQQHLPVTLNGAVGDKVTFIPTDIPTPPYYTITWKFNGYSFVIMGGTTIIRPEYMNRVIFNNNTFSVELRNLIKNDTGTYELTVLTAAPDYTASTSLQVFDKISNVTITPNATDFIEFNSSVSLNCSTSGSSPSFLWLNGSSEIKSGGRINLTDNNRTLIISNVRREETGPYTCEVSNPVSNDSSSLNITIYYGPENVTLTADPMIPLYISGSSLTLTCSAVSKPAAEFHWALNGTELNIISKELKLENIKSNQKGNYTCRAHNSKTLRNDISEPINIPVLEKVSEAKITVSPKDLGNGIPSSINMTCNGKGDISNTEWMKNDSKLSAGGNISFSVDYRILMINPASQTDAGVYKCNLSNSVSFNTAEYNLTFDRVPDGGEPLGGSLSGGAIAGIVIGVIVGVLLITALIVYIVKYKKVQIGFSASKSGGAQNNPEHELQYADIKHNQNRPVSNTPHNNQDGSNNVIYSDVNLSGNKPVKA